MGGTRFQETGHGGKFGSAAQNCANAVCREPRNGTFTWSWFVSQQNNNNQSQESNQQAGVTASEVDLERHGAQGVVLGEVVCISNHRHHGVLVIEILVRHPKGREVPAAAKHTWKPKFNPQKISVEEIKIENF